MLAACSSLPADPCGRRATERRRPRLAWRGTGRPPGFVHFTAGRSEPAPATRARFLQLLRLDLAQVTDHRSRARRSPGPRHGSLGGAPPPGLAAVTPASSRCTTADPIGPLRIDGELVSDGTLGRAAAALVGDARGRPAGLSLRPRGVSITAVVGRAGARRRRRRHHPRGGGADALHAALRSAQRHGADRDRVGARGAGRRRRLRGQGTPLACRPDADPAPRPGALLRRADAAGAARSARARRSGDAAGNVEAGQRRGGRSLAVGARRRQGAGLCVAATWTSPAEAEHSRGVLAGILARFAVSPAPATMVVTSMACSRRECGMTCWNAAPGPPDRLTDALNLDGGG